MSYADIMTDVLEAAIGGVLDDGSTESIVRRNLAAYGMTLDSFTCSRDGSLRVDVTAPGGLKLIGTIAAEIVEAA